MEEQSGCQCHKSFARRLTAQEYSACFPSGLRKTAALDFSQKIVSSDKIEYWARWKAGRGEVK